MIQIFAVGNFQFFLIVENNTKTHFQILLTSTFPTLSIHFFCFVFAVCTLYSFMNFSEFDIIFVSQFSSFIHCISFFICIHIIFNFKIRRLLHLILTSFHFLIHSDLRLFQRLAAKKIIWKKFTRLKLIYFLVRSLVIVHSIFFSFFFLHKDVYVTYRHSIELKICYRFTNEKKKYPMK